MEKIVNYEALYIVHPDLESSVDSVIKKVHALIEKRGGKVTYEENWGKRKLAYEIKKVDVGIYILCYFEAPTKGLSDIERDMRLTEEIIRYMIVVAAPEVKKVKKEKKVTSKAEEPKTEVETKVEKKKAPAKKESEKERMKKIDEKLEALLGDEEPK